MQDKPSKEATPIGLASLEVLGIDRWALLAELRR
jgi:hypothetical protein